MKKKYYYFIGAILIIALSFGLWKVYFSDDSECSIVPTNLIPHYDPAYPDLTFSYNGNMYSCKDMSQKMRTQKNLFKQ